MSVNGNYAGNLDPAYHIVLAGSSAETVFTASDSSNVAASWAFANTTGGAVTCKLIHTVGGTDFVVWQKSVPANDTEIESNLPIRLINGDIVKAVGASGVTVTVTMLAAFPFGGA